MNESTRQALQLGTPLEAENHKTTTLPLSPPAEPQPPQPAAAFLLLPSNENTCHRHANSLNKKCRLRRKLHLRTRMPKERRNDLLHHRYPLEKHRFPLR